MTDGIWGSDGVPWYGYMFLAIGIFIVFPEWCLDEISKLTGKEYILKHLLKMQLICASITAVAAFLVKHIYPELSWHEIIGWIGGAIMFLGIIRIVFWIVRQIFRSEFEDDENW